jgi:LemA protein
MSASPAISRPSPRVALHVAVLALLLPLLSACGFNTIPTNEENAKAAWSEVLNQYQRRADLIPNLVETVKGYAAHERETLEAVVAARAAATQVQINADNLTDPTAIAAFQAAQGELSGALSRLLAVVENYPDLKASQNFLALQAQLEGTENRIAVARRDYIDAVRVYNTALRTFPTIIWTWIWFTDAEPYATFTIDAEDQQPPAVTF